MLVAVRSIFCWNHHLDDDDQETVPGICNVCIDVTVASDYFLHLFIFLSLSAFREVINVGLKILASFSFTSEKLIFIPSFLLHSILQHVPEKILLSSFQFNGAATGFVLHAGDVLNIKFSLDLHFHIT